MILIESLKRKFLKPVSSEATIKINLVFFNRVLNIQKVVTLN